MTSHKHTIELEANKLHMCDVFKKLLLLAVLLLYCSFLHLLSFLTSGVQIPLTLSSSAWTFPRAILQIFLLTSGFYKSNFCWKKTKNKRYPKSEIFQKKQKIVKPFHYSFSNRFLEFNSHAGTANRHHFNVRPFTRTHAWQFQKCKAFKKGLNLTFVHH